MEKSIHPVPANEQERLEILKRYEVLDTLPEKQFDDITRLASIICGTPIALISLIDEGRQWFKSKVGMDVSETSRDVSFCQYAILENDVFEVQNTLTDQRFAGNPFVTGEPKVRFYAGAQLKTEEGYNLGTLCVIDTELKKLTDDQKDALRILSNAVMTNMELRRERNKMEEEKALIAGSNELLNAFLENGPSLITMKDMEGRYIYVNQHALAYLGKPASAVIGATSYQLSPEQLANEISKTELEVKTTRTINRHEYITGEGDTARNFVSYTFPLINSKEEIYGVGTISNDVTGAKKVEKALQKSNDSFLKIFYNSPVSMAIIAVKHIKLLNVNKAYLDMFEFTSQREVIGEMLQHLGITTREESERLQTIMQEKGFFLNEEIHLTTRNQKPLTLLCSVNPIEIDGEAVLLVNYVDITERKRLEMQLLEAKREAEQATISKSSFLANMSHEIRTPLNAILGFTDLLENTSPNPKQKEYIEIINSSGNNLLTIINDILDFSKIEAGMLSIERVPFGLQQLVHSAYTMFYSKAQSKNIQLFISIDPRLPAMVSGDPTRLSQIMINLIGNAVKFTQEGSVSVSCEVLQRSAEKVKVRFSIKDTGIGIAAEKVKEIFNRFTQADSDTTRTFGGTGLGLSIAKKLVELQGGEITVNSTPGRGSEFWFAIDYVIADERAYTPAKNQDTAEQGSFKGKRALIVEDNKVNQKLAKTHLDYEGFEVEIAENGQEAVELLREKTVDIILMDIQMPVLDGYQATKKIRRELQLSTPIIAMTANAMAGEQERCIEAGMDDYITKPFKAESLMSIIHKFLNGKREGANAAAVNETRPLDLTYLREFSMGKAHLMKEMVDVFLAQYVIDVKKLKEALQQEDYNNLRSLAHSMQTSLGFIGIDPLYLGMLKEAEQQSKNKTGIESIREKFSIIIEAGNRAEEELKALNL